jgi:hypothetical protein
MNRNKWIVVGVIVVALIVAGVAIYFTNKTDIGYDLALELEEKYGFVDVVDFLHIPFDDDTGETFSGIVALPLYGDVPDDDFMAFTVDAMDGIYEISEETDRIIVVVLVDDEGMARIELDCPPQHYEEADDIFENCIPIQVKPGIYLDMPWLGREPWQ